MTTTDTTKVQGYRVALSDNKPFGAVHVEHVQAATEEDAIFRAGIQAQLLGPVASTLHVVGVMSDEDDRREQEHEAAEAHAQQLHDEMVDDMYARGVIA